MDMLVHLSRTDSHQIAEYVRYFWVIHYELETFNSKKIALFFAEVGPTY